MRWRDVQVGGEPTGQRRSEPSPDLATVELLCVMQLIARRIGCTIRVHGASRELHDLIVLAGVEDVLLEPPSPGCAQPEET
jgi:hypothetical protein